MRKVGMKNCTTPGPESMYKIKKNIALIKKSVFYVS